MGETTDRLAAYRQAGVDLDVSNAASQIAASWAQTTWGGRAGEFGEPVASSSAFSSTKYLNLDEIRRRPNVHAVYGVDGTGTKPEAYELMRSFKGLGHDLIAMAADDIPVEGGQAVLVNNGLMVSTLTEATLPYIDELFEGLAGAAIEAGVVLFTGEIAVHGDRLQGPTDFTVDWLGDAMGLVHRDRVITGAEVQEGDELWAFAQPDGFRCNGISAARRAFREAYGRDWHTEKFGGSTIGEQAIAPSIIYSGLMTVLTGGYKIEVKPKVQVHGVAHISGGGVPEKVGRMLRATAFGADITDPFDPPEIMKHAQEITRVKNPDDSFRPMTDEEMVTTWHGGPGYIIAIDGKDGETVHSEAATLGIRAKKVGMVTKTPGIRMVSKGIHTPGKVMMF